MTTRHARLPAPHASVSDPPVPGAPERSLSEPGSSTALLEKEETSEDSADGDRYAHYVRKERITESAIMGQPVVALCGKVWTPSRNPDRFPICPTCKAIYEEMGKGGSGWPFGPDVPGSDK